MSQVQCPLSFVTWQLDKGPMTISPLSPVQCPLTNDKLQMTNYKLQLWHLPQLHHSIFAATDDRATIGTECYRQELTAVPLQGS